MVEVDQAGRPLSGLILRYVLTHYVHRLREATVADLVGCLERDGLRVAGRPSKVVSDALRWEIKRGRVVRVGRGRYVAGYLPRGTENRIQRRYRLAVAGTPWPAQRI
jgi:hypothetical protein